MRRNRSDTRRTSNSRSSVRKAAQKAGFRSGFEQRIAESLTEFGVEYEYETASYSYEIQEFRTYTPDFILPNGVTVECKGRLTTHDRKKLILVKQQHPELDLRLVFMYPNNKLSSKSKTRYWQWAEKHGFLWADNVVPGDWIA